VLKSLVEQGRVVEIGEGVGRVLLTAAGWARLVEAVVGTLGQYHREFPARLGIPRAELGSRLKMSARHQVVLQRLLDEGVIVEDAGLVRLPAHQVKLSPAQQAKVDAFLSALEASPYAPSRELIPEPELLNLLVVRRQVVKVAGDVVFSLAAYNEMVARVTAYLKSHGKVTVARVRDMFHTSRKYAVAFLEHLDGVKITRRVGDERVLY
jgi:selenocysteine-specific elongation factor